MDGGRWIVCRRWSVVGTSAVFEGGELAEPAQVADGAGEGVGEGAGEGVVHLFGQANPVSF